MPTILIDTREQNPLPITAYPTRRETLPVGDYGIDGFSDWRNPRFIVERKSLSDLCGSLGRDRDRFMREIEKMRQFSFRALVIEAEQAQVELAEYRSLIHPASVLGTLDALIVRANLHVIWAGGSLGAARVVESLVAKFAGRIEKDARLITADLPENPAPKKNLKKSEKGS